MSGIEGRGIQARRQVRAEMAYLRRLGRALTGNQSMADLAVVQLMEDLLVETDFIDASHNPRIALYRRLLSILEGVATVPPGHSVTAFPTPRSRQGYLLTAIEGFSNESAAEVLSVSLSEFCLLLDAAKAEIAQQVSSRVLIIEDEAFIVFELETVVTGLGHSVTGIARTHKEAIAEIDRNRPDLILSDVELADGSSGIEAVDEILTSADIPVVFITAHPELLLTGQRCEPAFVINKPFNAAAVRATVSQALYLSQLRNRAPGSSSGLDIAPRRTEPS